MDFEDFFAELDPRSRSLIVVNRTAPEPFQRKLEKAFDDQPVSVGESEIPGTDEDTVALVDESGAQHEVVAMSPLEELNRSVLMVNSDLYKSGAVGLEDFELPEVLVELGDVEFRLRGYPESNTEKLLLIVISRYIERHAWECGEGTLRSSFQRLSRINDERGTRAVYETVADTDVNTHVYGVPDWRPPPEFGVEAHGGHSEEFRNSWFVVYTPPADSEGDAVALLALEVAPREWRGFWTFRPSLVADIDGYIARNF